MTSASQSKLHSLLEQFTNIAIGYGVAVASQIAIFPLFDIHIPLADNFYIALWFTGVSLARGYLVRRMWNAIHVRTSR